MYDMHIPNRGQGVLLFSPMLAQLHSVRGMSKNYGSLAVCYMLQQQYIEGTNNSNNSIPILQEEEYYSSHTAV